MREDPEFRESQRRKVEIIARIKAIGVADKAAAKAAPAQGSLFDAPKPTR